MKNWIIAVDIGGTKISVALAQAVWGIVDKRVFATRFNREIATSYEEIVSAIKLLLGKRKLTKQDLLGIGVGVPGPVNFRTGSVGVSPNLPGWQGFRIKAKLVQQFGVAVFVENDANSAALGELYFGAGKRVSDFVYLTVSTGIGGGIVAGGSLVRGATGSAGEVGHMTVLKNGRRCKCGKRGCWEAYASGTGMVRHVLEGIEKGARTKLKNLPSTALSGKTIMEAARQGDPVAVQARAAAADFLGVGIGNLINILNPRRIILGGGVMNSARDLWKPMMKAIRREAWPILLKECKICMSRLGNDVGDLGATALVIDSLKK